MRISNYFKAARITPKFSVPSRTTPITDKDVPLTDLNSTVTALPRSGSRDGSRTPATGRTQSQSLESTNSSFLDEIKYEAMVNYLYQKQCSNLWVGDESGGFEGVLLRKARNEYFACPPPLANSAFAAACAQLNVQASRLLSYNHVMLSGQR